MTHRCFLPLTTLTAGLLISLQAAADTSLLAVYCQTDTDNAVIYVDGRESSTCTEGQRQVIPLDPGEHRIEVVRSHGAEYEQRFATEITAEAGVPVRVRVSLPEKTLTAYGKQMAEEREKASRLAAEKAAFEKKLSAAREGDPEAMDAVAASYLSGRGVKKDPQKASYWQQQASAVREARQKEKERQEFEATLAQALDTSAGYEERMEAMETVIRNYRDGHGTEASAEKARTWQTRLQQLRKEAEREERIAAARKELDEVVYFPFLSSTQDVMSRGQDDSTTYVMLLPALTVMDLVSVPTTTTEHISASNKLKDAETHASRWASPESMVAQAFSE